MGLWILEPKTQHPVQGTVVLFDDDHVLENRAGLKVGPDGIVVLVPQPSNDPAGRRVRRVLEHKFKFSPLA